jgi:hypothetical protein
MNEAPYTCQQCERPREVAGQVCPHCGAYGVIAAATGHAKGSALRALQQMHEAVNELGE